MKITTILSALLPTVLALPLTIPTPATAEIVTRDTAKPNSLFAVKYRKDLINDPQKRAEALEPIFPVRYSSDAAQDAEKRAENVGFPTKYSKDIIDPSQKRSESPSIFSVRYRKDVIDSKAPAAKMETREPGQPASLFAVGYRKDIIPSQE